MEYETGKWYGWQCDWENPPVHPESEVEVTNGSGRHKQKSKYTNWDAVIAFRVITPYVEPPKPREFWLSMEEHEIHPNLRSLRASCGEYAEYIHVREVLPK